MDIIMIAVFQLLFIGGAIYGGYRLIRFLESKGIRTTETPEERQKWEQMKKAGLSLVEKVPGFTPEDKELSREEGTWATAAPLPVAFDAILKQFTTKKIAGPKHTWKSIKPLQQYKQIFFEAGWQDKNEHYVHDTAVTLELTFEPIDAGGTVIHFKYTVVANNLFNVDLAAGQLVKNSNKWIREICTMLTANPEHEGLI